MTSFIRVTWLHSCVWHDSMHTCDMTHSYAWHYSFICVTWLHFYVWHDSFSYMTWSHAYWGHDPFVYLRRMYIHGSFLIVCTLIFKNKKMSRRASCHRQSHIETFLYMTWSHSYGGTWLNPTCDTTHSCVRRDLFPCAPRTHADTPSHAHITIATLPHSYMRHHDSFLYLTWLIHMCDCTAHIAIARTGRSPYNSEHTPIRSPTGATTYEHLVSYSPWLIRICDTTLSNVYTRWLRLVGSLKL